MTPPAGSGILSEEVLKRFRARAPRYDRENRFFQEDFDELRQVGYLTIAVPRDLRGQGLSFAECMREQRRLGYYAHATALAMNMHLYWVGVAADLWRAGDRSLEWVLRGAVNGEVFAAGHAPSSTATSPSGWPGSCRAARSSRSRAPSTRCTRTTPRRSSPR